jgi:hypothetical protein
MGEAEKWPVRAECGVGVSPGFRMQAPSVERWCPESEIRLRICRLRDWADRSRSYTLLLSMKSLGEEIEPPGRPRQNDGT